MAAKKTRWRVGMRIEVRPGGGSLEFGWLPGRIVARDVNGFPWKGRYDDPPLGGSDEWFSDDLDDRRYFRRPRAKAVSR